MIKDDTAQYGTPVVILVGLSVELVGPLTETLSGCGYAIQSQVFTSEQPTIVVATHAGLATLGPLPASTALVLLGQEAPRDALDGVAVVVPVAGASSCEQLLDAIAWAYARLTTPTRPLAAERASGSDDLLETLVQGLRVQHDYLHLTLYLRDGAALHRRALACLVADMAIPTATVVLEDGILGRVAQTELPAFDSSGEYPQIVVPVQRAGKLFGVLSVGLRQERLSAAEMSTHLTDLARCAAQVAAFLEQAVVGQREARRAREILALQRISAAMAAEDHAGLDTALGAVVGELAETFAYRLVAIILIEGEHTDPTAQLVVAAGTGLLGASARPFPITHGVIGRVARTGQACLVTQPDAYPDYIPYLAEITSEICVPILHEGVPIGVIDVEQADQPLLDEDDLALLRLVGEHLGLLIANARLRAATNAARIEAERRAAGLAALLKIGMTLTQQHDYATLLDQIDTHITTLIPSDDAGIYRLEPDTGDLVAERLHLTLGSLPARLSQGLGLCGWVARHGEPVLIDDARTDSRFYWTTGAMPRPRRMLIAPLPAQQGTLGVICLMRDAGAPFTPLDRDLLVGFSAQVAVAIGQTRFYAEQQQRIREVEALNTLAASLASLDLDQVLQELVAQLHTLIGAEQVVVNLLDADEATLLVRAAAGSGSAQLIGTTIAVDESFSGDVIRSGQSQQWNFALPGPPLLLYGHHDSRYLPRAVIGVPLLVRGRALGALIATSVRPDYFTPDHLRFLSAAAGQAAVALHNASLYTDTLHLARFDALTGLANRRYCMEVLTDAVARATRYRRPLSLMVIDLDNFKTVNDTFGHLAGDALLRLVAERLGRRLRRGDLAARYAGDELAVVLPETDLAGALVLGEQLRTAINAEPFVLDDGAVARLTLSIGVSAHLGMASVSDLLQAADGAMYFAKHGGRDRVCGPEAARDILGHGAEEISALLQGGNQMVIEELAAAADARVPESVGQSSQIAGLAVALGRELGLDEMALHGLRSAALVHDLGEVAIAPEILGRDGPLTGSEWNKVRAHPRYGCELLFSVPAYQELLPIILHHHEHWDGGGYPDGLVGEEIPPGARIIAVAAAWIAQTTVRPYRAALTASVALTEMQRHAGGQFDPALIAALPGALRRFDPAVARQVVVTVPGQ